MKLRPEKPLIMHLVLSIETGGLERIVADSALAVDRATFAVEICCFDRLGDFAADLERGGVTVTLLKKNQEHYDYFYPFRLAKFLVAKKVKVLHMHSGTFFLGIQAALLARIPVTVYTDHGRHLVETRLQLLTDRFSGCFVDRIVAVSRELEKYLVDVVKLPARKMSTIINGINTEVFSRRDKPQHLLQELQIGMDQPVIGTVGRLVEVKDQATMIEALALVKERVPDVILLLVGDGPMREALRKVAQDRGVSGSVRFVGNRRDISALLNLFDVFLLTSLSEGTSVSLLEAMSSGLPAVVTRVGGNPSLIRNDLNGIVVEPGQPGAVASALLSLLLAPRLRQEFGERSTAMVAKNYSMTAMLHAYRTLYLGVAKDKGILLRQCETPSAYTTEYVD